MSDTRTIETLVDLEHDYVIVQTDDVRIEEVLERRTQGQSASELHDIVLQLWKIRATPTIRTKYPSDKPKDKQQRYYLSLNSRLTRPKNKTWAINTHDFDKKFVAWSTADDQHKSALIAIANYGEAKARVEYIYKRVKIQLGGDQRMRTVLFRPSKYVMKEGDIWSLIVQCRFC
jgi:hypothetical protein